MASRGWISGRSGVHLTDYMVEERSGSRDPILKSLRT